ncbi:MAG: tetraacyldisaccharide 4'-kinase [Desulfobacca sp.]|nr:tetraacyldisaccharide 4'-kinase [Desulfobacca sp.]
MRTIWAKRLLFPLSWMGAQLYGLGVGLRLWLYRLQLLPSRRLPLKVISIGNLVVGGTGKTPHAALLGGYLHKKGIRVAILSRGYRGTKMKTGAVISDGLSMLGTVEEGGEEPYWLAQKLPGVPVVVGQDRYRSGLLCGQKWQTQWVVLDDGFQHLSLQREINILLLPGHQPYGTGKLIPLGRLREPIREMQRANSILITHAERLDPVGRNNLKKDIQSRTSNLPVFFSEHRPAALWRYPDKTVLALSWLEGKRVLAFCGLAEPESFIFSLKQLGIDPVKLVEFPDHYFYQEKDKKSLERLCRSLQINLLLTTEKDALKLGEWKVADLQILVLGIEVGIEDQAFWKWLDQRISHEA